MDTILKLLFESSSFPPNSSEPGKVKLVQIKLLCLCVCVCSLSLSTPLLIQRELLNDDVSFKQRLYIALLSLELCLAAIPTLSKGCSVITAHFYTRLVKAHRTGIL